MKAALSLLYFFTGAPCIFYGTEILTVGGYDPDCRRCMDWERTGEDGDCTDILHLLQKLSKLRIEQKLADGRIKIYEQSDMLVLENITKERVIRLVINKTNQKHKIDTEELEPNSFHISLNGGIIIDEKTI